MAVNPVQELQERVNWHWRNTMRPIRFFGLDARAVIPFTLWLVYLRPVTIVLTILSTALFVILEKQGLTFPAAMRKFRRMMISDIRPGKSMFRYRRMQDFG